MKISLPLVVAIALAATVVYAAEQRVALKDGPGRDKVEANCASCHSLDYIQGNSPFMNRGVWDAEVTKMIKAYGAPVSDADAREIVDYLTKNYGQP
ncbi:MAG TPA: cytochrome c [Casimicrobiaceae bacterium]|jgi:mono/diheme cytochrome c family protein|nr:cytochrome c [Casimicrobiaceae bacterium]